MEKIYDLLVIGWGKAGKTLSAKLGAKEKKVAIIEENPKMYGGTCINVGCLPTKSLVHSAKILSEAKKYGIDGDYSFKNNFFKEAMKKKEEIEITDYKGFGDLQLAWCYALIDEKEKAKKYFENVDKYLASSLEKDEELKKDYNIVKELINSNIYFN